ncbi:MAG: hypothetical protein HUU27_07995 [Phycisphaerae bacterium]|nr:hypothetical protein [Phycisphaerae bacterium]
MADHGLAISNSRADARSRFGGSALADSESIAATVGGVSISNSEAIARGQLFGRAESFSTSTALSNHGVALSDSRAVSRGLLGGRAVSVSDSIADTFGGVAISGVEADSAAGFRAHSFSNGVGVSVSGPLRTATAKVYAGSRAGALGVSRSNAAVIEIRR